MIENYWPAGNPAVMVPASALGLDGRESHSTLPPAHLLRLESVRVAAAVAMRLPASAAIPKVFWVAPVLPFQTSRGITVDASHADLNARVVSMGRVHHAMTGTGCIGLAAAAAVPGTIVCDALGGVPRSQWRAAHPAGVVALGAAASCHPTTGSWAVDKVVLERSARRLMVGHTPVPNRVWHGQTAKF